MSPEKNDLALWNLSCMLDYKQRNLFKLTRKELEDKNNLPFSCINSFRVKVSSLKQWEQWFTSSTLVTVRTAQHDANLQLRQNLATLSAAVVWSTIHTYYCVVTPVFTFSFSTLWNEIRKEHTHDIFVCHAIRKRNNVLTSVWYCAN